MQVEERLLGKRSHRAQLELYSVGNAGGRQVAAGLVRRWCFCLNTEGDKLAENVNQERERCVAWIGGSEMRRGDQ